MKKRWKAIILVVLLSVLTGTLVVSRHSIISYLLRYATEAGTMGKVTLDPGKLYMNLKTWEVDITHPALEFDETWLSGKDSLQLRRLVFRKFIIKGLSFSKLLFDRAIICESLTAEEPEVILVSSGKHSGSTVDKSGFDPFLIIRILKNKSFGSTDIRLNIKNTTIRFGKVNLLEKSASNSIGSAVYSIDFKGLRSEHPEGMPNTLGYDALTAMIGSLDYYFPRSGFRLQLDTALYHSEKKRLELQGLELRHNNNSYSSGIQSLKAGFIALQGIVLDNTDSLNIKKLHLRSFTIKDTRLVYKKKKNKPGNQDQSSFLPLLYSVFTKILFDTLEFRKIDLQIKGLNNKPAASFEGLNFVARQVLLDSSMTESLLNKIKFKNPTGELAEFKLNFDSASLSGSSVKLNRRSVSVNRLNFNSDKRNRHINLEIRTAQIADFSLHRLQKGRQQSLEINIDKPRLTVRNHNGDQSHSIPSVELYQLFPLKKLTISDGTVVSVWEHKGDSLRVNGLYLTIANNAFRELFDSIPHINRKNIIVKAQSAYYFLSRQKLMTLANNIRFDSTQLTFDDLKMIRSGRQKQYLKTGKTKLTGTDADALVFHGKLIADKVIVTHPVLNIQISKGKRVVQHNKNKPFNYRIGKIVADSGDLSLKLSGKKDTIFVKTFFSFTTHLIEQQKDTLPWLCFTGKKRKMNLKHLVVKKGFMTVKVKDFTVDETGGRIKAEKIGIHDTKKQVDGFLSGIELTGVDFQQLNHNIIKGSKMILNGDSLHAFLPLHRHQGNEMPPNITTSMFFDTIAVNFRKIAISGNDQWELQNAQISWYPFQGKTDITNDSTNLLERISYRAESLDYRSEKNRWNVQLKGLSKVRGRAPLQFDSLYASHRLTAKSTGKKIPVFLSAGRFRILRPEYIPANRFIHGQKLLVSSLKISVGKTTLLNPEAETKTETLLQGLPFGFALDTLVCPHVDFRYSDQTGTVRSIDNTGLTAIAQGWKKGVAFSSTPYLSSVIQVDLRNKSIFSSDSLYKTTLKGFKLDLKQHRFTLDTVRTVPVADDSLFFAKSGYQTDRVRWSIDKTYVDNIDIDTLVKSGFLSMTKVTAEGVNADILRNKHYPLQPDIRKKMPLEIIQSIPLPFYTDTLNITNARFTYSEIPEETYEAGKVFFTGVQSLWTAVTNRAENRPEFLTLKSVTTGKLMDDAPFNIRLFIPYKNNKNNYFWFDARLEPLEMTTLNSLTQKLMGITIRSGTGSVDIPFASGNETYAKGKMIFRYKRLKFGLYNRKKAEEYKGMATPFINFLLNNIMIRSNNPRFFGKTKTGVIYFERDPQKSFMNYIWKSVLSGALSTMGFNSKEQRREKKEWKKSEKEKQLEK